MPWPSAPAGFVVRFHSAAAPPVASSVARGRHAAAVGDDAGAAPAGRPQADDPLTLGDPDARMGAHALGENARDLLPGRGAAGVEDAATECPPSRPGSSSNSTPRSTRSTIRAGASSVSTRTALGRDSPRPGMERVLRVQRR